jgi:hypothetical protein
MFRHKEAPPLPPKRSLDTYNYPARVKLVNERRASLIDRAGSLPNRLTFTDGFD